MVVTVVLALKYAAKAAEAPPAPPVQFCGTLPPDIVVPLIVVISV
jgi:hypothetical protein